MVPPLTRWTLLFAWVVLLQTAPVIAFGILVPVPVVWLGRWVRDFWILAAMSPEARAEGLDRRQRRKQRNVAAERATPPRS